MAIALDEPRENDQTFEIDGFTYIIDKELLEKAQPVTVDFKIFGFQIDSQLVLEPAEGGCSACSTSSGCSTQQR